ncbi:MAG: porin [Bacteroidetes bacterium]|nr:MAG: porin [Bacteroidota bacterium]
MCITLAINVLLAQGSDLYGSGLKLNLDTSGKRYVRFIIWNQIWMRSIQNNPGTQVNGENAANTWDVGARRLRVLAYAQISPRYLVLAHIGINNQTFATGGASAAAGTGPYGQGKKPQLFFHDAWNEFAVVPAINPTTKKVNKNSLYVGAGLHYWWGISRISSASTLNFMAIDAPIINWPLVEVSDQFVRQYGIYAKGKLGKLNYSMHLNKPFATNLATANPDATKGPTATDYNANPKAAWGGYFDYQFFEQESNLLPFRVGSYLGTKKVLNVGAGFYHNKDGTRSKPSVTATAPFTKHDITLLGADVFADLPIGPKAKHMAITAYSVFYNYNFGPNYLRAVGIMNPASGFDPAMAAADRTINGPGNGRIFVGTGSLWYTQAGLLLPSGKQSKMRVQPFAAYTFKKLEALDQAGSYFDVGANFYIDGHHAKITPQYSTRPLYYNQNGKRQINGTRGEFLLQFQVYL